MYLLIMSFGTMALITVAYIHIAGLFDALNDRLDRQLGKDKPE